MPAPGIALLCAKLGIRAYAMPLVPNPGAPDLSDLGRSVEGIIMGVDASIGPVPYGFVSTGSDGVIATLRGTAMPDGSYVEWIDDFDAFLEPCPLHDRSQWHRGFGRVYSSLSINGVPLGEALYDTAGLIVHGHSLGGPLATYAAVEAHAHQLILFASPKPGDSDFRDHVQTTITAILSYANPNDAVPRVPLTVDWPLRIEDFQPVVPPYELNPRSVTPAIPSDWASSHHLPNYLSLLEALP